MCWRTEGWSCSGLHALTAQTPPRTHSCWCQGPLSTPSPHKTCCGSVCNRGKKAGPGPRKTLPLIGCDKLAATTQRL